MSDFETPALAALAALLAYPDGDWLSALDDIEAEFVAARLSPPTRAALRALIEQSRSLDLYALQERYVDLFDRSRHLTLNLFEHVHGESRDRGQAMVDLAALYEGAGMEISARELPDYLPLFLEFAATRPRAEADELIGNAAPVIALLEARHVERASGYACVFAAILEIAAAPRVEVAMTTPEPDDLSALDAEWEETPVRFGPDAESGCPIDRLRTRVRAERRDARQPHA
jgi:nitrate reductase delta subunit